VTFDLHVVSISLVVLYFVQNWHYICFLCSLCICFMICPSVYCCSSHEWIKDINIFITLGYACLFYFNLWQSLSWRSQLYAESLCNRILISFLTYTVWILLQIIHPHDGSVIRILGILDPLPGHKFKRTEFNQPTGIAVSQDRVVVVDFGNKRIKVRPHLFLLSQLYDKNYPQTEKSCSFHK
jgi:hypothetical protein